MIIDKENYYFIAPDNKNGLSVRPPRDLYLSDTFEFKVNFTVDFEKCQGKSRGIVMMNGKHLGIHIWNKKLNGSVWTEDGVFDTYQNVGSKDIERAQENGVFSAIEDYIAEAGTGKDDLKTTLTMADLGYGAFITPEQLEFTSVFDPGTKEKMRKVGSKGAPTKQAFINKEKTAKKK